MDNKEFYENMRTQLSELNNRARTYASQLWQVPFGYLALVGVLLTKFDGQFSVPASVFISALGISVLIHMFFAVNFHNKTVQKIIDLEAKMGLDRATNIGPGGTVAPFMAIVFLGTLSPIVVSFQTSLICLIVLLGIAIILFFILTYFACNRMSVKSIAEKSNDVTINQNDSKGG